MSLFPGLRNPGGLVFVAAIGILSALGDATPIGPLLNEPFLREVAAPGGVDAVTEAVEGPRTQLQLTGVTYL